MTYEEHVVDGLTRRRHELATEWLSVVEPQLASHVWLAQDMTGVVQHIARFVADESYPLTKQEDAGEALWRFAALRRDGGGSPAHLLRDFDALACVLDGAATLLLQSYEHPVRADEVARVTARLQRAPLLLGTIAIDAYWRDDGLAEVPLRFQQFADAVTQELKRPLDAAAVTAQLLEYAEGDMRSSAEARRLAVLIQRNLARAETALQHVRHSALALDGDGTAAAAIVRESTGANGS